MGLRRLRPGLYEAMPDEDQRIHALMSPTPGVVDVETWSAPPWRQLAANLVDATILTTFAVLADAHVGTNGQLPQGVAIPLLILLPTYIFGWAFSATPGMLVAGVRPIDASGASAMSARQAATRAGIWLALMVPVCVGGAVRLVTRRRRGWLDRVCGTRVVVTRPRVLRPLVWAHPLAGLRTSTRSAPTTRSTDLDP